MRVLTKSEEESAKGSTKNLQHLVLSKLHLKERYFALYEHVRHCQCLSVIVLACLLARAACVAELPT
jgi:hypothetical protein